MAYKQNTLGYLDNLLGKLVYVIHSTRTKNGITKLIDKGYIGHATLRKFVVYSNEGHAIFCVNTKNREHMGILYMELISTIHADNSIFVDNLQKLGYIGSLASLANGECAEKFFTVAEKKSTVSAHPCV